MAKRYKCRVTGCRHSSPTLNGMMIHHAKAHPKQTKPSKPKRRKRIITEERMINFCPCCGFELARLT